MKSVKKVVYFFLLVLMLGNEGYGVNCVYGCLLEKESYPSLCLKVACMYALYPILYVLAVE